MTAKNTPENFWSKVAVGDAKRCWEWKGRKTSSGYGSLSWHGSPVQAHRVAYFLALGGIELATNFRQQGVARKYQKFVLHSCDNRVCCNPEHLFLGSMRANQLDAYSKGRKQQPKSRHVNAKLTAAQVNAIRRRYNSGGVTQMVLAKEYKVTQRVISLIVRHESYKDVK